MKKEEIAKLLGYGKLVNENFNGTAYEVLIQGRSFDLVITIPFEVHEIYYEAKDKEGNSLLKDWRDHYGETEIEDYKESLLEVVKTMNSPLFRMVNEGKTVEVKSDGWFYLFGRFGS
jgi:hypothetical protein